MQERRLKKPERNTGYKLKITEHANELLDRLVYHLIDYLKNEQAAKHLLSELDRIYDRLEENSFQFPRSRDGYLVRKGYREAIVLHMNYVVVFEVRKDIVNIVGFFHQLENYQNKL